MALRPHYLLDREAQDAAAPMAGNGELGGVALWSASACAGYTGGGERDEANSPRTFPAAEDVRRRRYVRRSSGEPE